MTTPLAHRLAAAALSGAAAFTIVLQTILDMTIGGLSFLGALWDQYLFFTNITVLLVAVTGTWIAIRGWTGPSWPAGLTLWMALTGVIYHTLLAADHNPEGLDIVVNVFQHTVLPLGTMMLWVLYAPKSPLTWQAPFLWALYPIAYAAFGLIAGAIGGRYPYFFLNPVKTGWPGVGLYVVGIGVLFLLGGFGIYALARRLDQR